MAGRGHSLHQVVSSQPTHTSTMSTNNCTNKLQNSRQKDVPNGGGRATQSAPPAMRCSTTTVYTLVMAAGWQRRPYNGVTAEFFIVIGFLRVRFAKIKKNPIEVNTLGRRPGGPNSSHIAWDSHQQCVKELVTSYGIRFSLRAILLYFCGALPLICKKGGPPLILLNS